MRKLLLLLLEKVKVTKSQKWKLLRAQLESAINFPAAAVAAGNQKRKY